MNIEGKIIPNAVIPGKLQVFIYFYFCFYFYFYFYFRFNLQFIDVSKIDTATTRVVLNGAQYAARIKANGEFNM